MTGPTKYIKAPLAGSIQQYIDRELRKIELALNSVIAPTRQVWTPVVIGSTTPGSATYTQQEGHYYRSGALVVFQCRVIWSNHTGTGSMIIGGLPEPVGIAPFRYFAGSYTWLGNTAGCALISSLNAGVPNSIVFRNAAGTPNPVVAAGDLIVGGSYIVG